MIDTLFIGLSVGSILLLVALGLAITYGVMGVINMAHGELVMVGAYTTVMSGLWLRTGILIASKNLTKQPINNIIPWANNKLDRN